MNQEVIDRIRDFNRHYVRTIGLLNSSIHNSGYSLTEAHVLNLLYQQECDSASTINQVLCLDEGYLSRVIKKLLKLGLLIKKQSQEDKRIYLLSLTEKGKSEYEKLDIQSSELIANKIQHLSNDAQQELAQLMGRAKELLKK